MIKKESIEKMLWELNFSRIFEDLVIVYAQQPDDVAEMLQEVFKNSREDARAIYDNDPAATDIEEVMETYITFKAILAYRLAHVLWEDGFKKEARYISEVAHSITGIDIHPGARIGKRFAIDHGTGIVIGETTEIGDNVKIYQGVTLGAIHLDNREQVNQKRHPTVRDNVTIYANATVLGGNTIIGENSIIGANAFVTKSVEPDSKVYYTV